MEELLALFPANTSVGPDGRLALAGCPTDELADIFDTPLMVVDEESLRARALEYLRELRAGRRNTRVVFASKAFPCTAVQRVLITCGLGLDVAGGGEFMTAVAAGVRAADLIVHGNAKSNEEIRMAVEFGAGLIVIDNLDDIDRLDGIVPAGSPQDVLVRLRPDVVADTHAHTRTGHERSKFGMGRTTTLEAMARIGRSAKLNLLGVHCHVGSQIFDLEPFVASVSALASLGEFPVYNIGGGLGESATYRSESPTIAEYARAVTTAANALLPREAQLIVEPGRSVVAGTTVTLYRVVTVKRDVVTFAAVDGGLGDNVEPAMYGQRFEAALPSRFREAAEEFVTVVGRHCDSADVLVDGVLVPRPRVGDLLAVPATGAYCYSMGNNYNGARRPPVVMVAQGEARLVVRRETWSDLLARDTEQGSADAPPPVDRTSSGTPR